MTATERIINYLSEDNDLFNRLCEELDSWDGYLGDDRYYPMYELSDLLSGKDVIDVLMMAHYGNFNPSDEYFRFNGYGNLESTDFIDYADDYLDKYFVQELSENRAHIDIDDAELEELLDELDNE